MVCKIEWHQDELFARVGFVVTNSRLSCAKVVKVYNGRGDVENRIKEGKNTLRWDKTSCHRFDANQARLKMGVIAYNLLHTLTHVTRVLSQGRGSQTLHGVADSADHQGRRPGAVSRSAVVGARGFGFSADSSLPGGTGLRLRTMYSLSSRRFQRVAITENQKACVCLSILAG